MTRPEPGVTASARPAGVTVVVLHRLAAVAGVLRSAPAPTCSCTTTTCSTTTHGWRNRNRIKTQSGPVWLTVPVRHGEGFLRILDPAVVHVDNTVRPQVVFREQNPEYHDVVAHFGRTGIVNTSFNRREEPIVNTPADVIRSLKKGDVDTLIAGNFVISAGRS